ncbi:MAG: guanylate kinase [Deferribacteraceae bacterium]|jgi:guanylate kinase|nr:guanylate kinase [Deferribacteraceae bacterium]
MRKGRLFVVSAPSGSGKTTLCRMLLDKFNTLSYSVSHTTRAARAGEVDGESYFFVDKNKFNEMIDKDDFLEYAFVHDNLYGTSKSMIESMLASGKDILLDIDPQGAMQLKSKISYGIYIFIVPPSISELKERLIKRNDTDALDLRMHNATQEMMYVKEYDYLVVNKELERAFNELSSIYVAEGCRTNVVSNINSLCDINH